MDEVVIKKEDAIIMSLVHYFITEENYNPIILHGVNDEIWLENLNNPYKVIRIVNHYIHNNDQLSFDRFKLNKISSQIKKKTFSFKMKVLSIYTNLGDNVTLNEDAPDSVSVTKNADLKNPVLLEIFPNIGEKTKHKEKGIDLFVKITDDINKDNAKKNKKAEKLFSKKEPYITKIIIVVCFIVFILMSLSEMNKDVNEVLIDFGANWDILTRSGQYYRLITSAFVHIGIIHLLVNMYSLYIIGSQVEGFFGKLKFLAIYFISALTGSLLSVAFSNNVISAGASGAIFGLLGALAYFGYNYRVYLGNVLRSQIIPVIIINLAVGFTLNNVDNYAHIGGLIGGFLTAYAFGVNNKNTLSEKINGWIVFAIYLVFCIYIAFFR